MLGKVFCIRTFLIAQCLHLVGAFAELCRHIISMPGMFEESLLAVATAEGFD
jgi:hypothetical protein